MLLKFGIKNLRHNLLLNILIVLQMTVVFILLISMISTIVSRFQYYIPIKKQLNSIGHFYYVNHAINPETQRTLRQKEELHGLVEDLEDAFGAYSVWLSYKNEEASFVSYDDEIIEMFEPEMESGVWFDLDKNQDDVIQVVVSENPYGFKVGDRVSFDSFGIEIKAEIIGVLKKNTKIIGYLFSDDGEINCKNAFINYNYEIEEKPLFILNQKSLIDKQVVMNLNGPTFMTYLPDISDETLEANNNSICRVGVMGAFTFDEMKKNSMKYIFAQVYSLLPIIICILILTLVASVSSGALSVKRQMRNYAIYYTCGLRWRDCSKINFYSALIGLCVSFFLSIIVIVFINNNDIIGGTVIGFGVWQLLGCIVLGIVYMFLSLLLPINIIGKNTPAEILKSN